MCLWGVAPGLAVGEGCRALAAGAWSRGQAPPPSGVAWFMVFDQHTYFRRVLFNKNHKHFLVCFGPHPSNTSSPPCVAALPSSSDLILEVGQGRSLSLRQEQRCRAQGWGWVPGHSHLREMGAASDTDQVSAAVRYTVTFKA